MDLQKRLLEQVLGFGRIPAQGGQVAAERRRDRGIDAIERFEPARLVVHHPSAQLGFVEPRPRRSSIRDLLLGSLRCHAREFSTGPAAGAKDTNPGLRANSDREGTS